MGRGARDRWKNQISRWNGMTGREKWYGALSLAHLIGIRGAEMCEWGNGENWRRNIGGFKELLPESWVVLRRFAEQGCDCRVFQPNCKGVVGCVWMMGTLWMCSRCVPAGPGCCRRTAGTRWSSQCSGPGGTSAAVIDADGGVVLMRKRTKPEMYFWFKGVE